MEKTGSFGDKIRAMRKARKLSVNKLAEISGVNPGTLSRLERGLQKPTFPNIKKLSKGLNVSPGILMEMAGYLDSPSVGEVREALSLSSPDIKLL